MESADPASPIRDKLQACRLLAVSMTLANLRMLDRSLPQRSNARRGRMGTNLQGERGPPCGPTGRARATVKNRETRPGSGRTATTGPTGPDRPSSTRCPILDSMHPYGDCFRTV
jgi:hypothetical protein